MCNCTSEVWSFGASRNDERWIASSRSLSSGAHSRDPLAPRNDAYNRLTTRWTDCGKPVDDRSEKPVHLPCGSLGQSCEKPGYVSVHNAGYKPCARSRQAVNNG
jgi:hypothetical protein